MDADVSEMLKRITYHAVTRYVQRIIGAPPVAGPFADAMEEAEAHCDAVGKSVEDVRRMILVPVVVAAIVAGAHTARTAAFTAILGFSKPGDRKTVVTVYHPQDQSHHGHKIYSSRTEGRRASAQRARRNRKRPATSLVAP